VNGDSFDGQSTSRTDEPSTHLFQDDFHIGGEGGREGGRGIDERTNKGGREGGRG